MSTNQIKQNNESPRRNNFMKIIDHYLPYRADSHRQPRWKACRTSKLLAKVPLEIKSAHRQIMQMLIFPQEVLESEMVEKSLKVVWWTFCKALKCEEPCSFKSRTSSGWRLVFLWVVTVWMFSFYFWRPYNKNVSGACNSTYSLCGKLESIICMNFFKNLNGQLTLPQKFNSAYRLELEQYKNNTV